MSRVHLNSRKVVAILVLEAALNGFPKPATLEPLQQGKNPRRPEHCPERKLKPYCRMSKQEKARFVQEMLRKFHAIEDAVLVPRPTLESRGGAMGISHDGGDALG